MNYVKERIGALSTLSILLILTIMLVVSILVAVSIGVVKISIDDVWGTLIYNVVYKLTGIQIGDPAKYGSGMIYDIVWNTRAPRVFLAVIVGMSLALAGVVMQATVQNPLADPYILGMSSGASLGATAAISLGVSSILGMKYNSIGLALFAFVGSLAASVFVLMLASAGGRMTSVKLVLSGTIVSCLFAAVSNFIIVMAADAEEMQAITFWLLGSFSSARWYKISIPLVALILSTIYFMTQIRSLNTMLIGDDAATALGMDLVKKRRIYIALVSLLTATAVCFCGIIGFVGLMIPHIVRGITGNNHWKLLPLSVVLGGVFMVLTDILSRTLLNGAELPIGIITAFCGAPIFAYIMIRKTYSFGGQ